MYDDGSVCMRVRINKEEEEEAKGVCAEFWKRPFTPDSDDWSYKVFLPLSRLISFDYWQKLTEEHNSPDFMLNYIKNSDKPQSVEKLLYGYRVI